jgi:peptide deformylase
MAEEIIKDISQLRDVSRMENCSSLEEAKLLAKEMFKALATQKTAPAIAANQIGIQKRIIVMSIREPIYLVNPVIVSSSMPIPYIESHASFPQKLFTTMRYASVTVKADNINGEFTFGLKENQKHLLYNKDKVNVAVTTHPVIMEAVYIQQTIDTLNGILPMDRELKTTEALYKIKTPNRNKIVTLVKGNEEIQVKYKRALKYLEDGWVIKEDKE